MNIGMSSVKSLLDNLRLATHDLFTHQSTNPKITFDDSDQYVVAVCVAIENCMKHGLALISGRKETVSLWGLLHWTNVMQLRNNKQWLLRQEEKNKEIETNSWYNELFKEELNQIKAISGSLPTHREPQFSDDTTEKSPATPGFNAIVRTVGSLYLVRTHRGKVRAWIQQCLNTHKLSSCLTGLMCPSNLQLLTSYFTPGALMTDTDARDVFISITATLDRLRFGFHIDNAKLDEEFFEVSNQRDSSSNEPVFVSLSTNDSESEDTGRKISEKENETFLKQDKISLKSRIIYAILKHSPKWILSPSPMANQKTGFFSKRLFGVSIQKLIMNENTCEFASVDPMLGIPNFVEGCCRVIEASICTPGLLVTECSVSKKKLIKSVKNSGVLSVWSNVHHATTVLIEFLKSLPEPFLSLAIIKQIQMKQFEKVEDLDKVKILRHIIDELPWSYKCTILRLMGTFSTALQHEYSSQNGLNFSILAKVIAPVFVNWGDLDEEEKSTVMSIMEILLSRYGDVFRDLRQQLNRRRAMLQKKIESINEISYLKRTEIDLDEPSHLNRISRLLYRLKLAAGVVSVDNNAEEDSSRVVVQELLQDSAWQTLGFHMANPSKNLKGGGILVLDCILYFLEEHEEIARQIIKLRSSKAKTNYPFQTASVYIVRMLHSLLSFEDQQLSISKPITLWTDKWSSWCLCTRKKQSELLSQYTQSEEIQEMLNGIKVEETSEATIDVKLALQIHSMGLWKLFNDAAAFQRLFGMCILLFDRNWTRSGANCMDFNTILSETRCQLSTLISQKPESISELWQIWVGARSRQRQDMAEGPNAVAVASAHMRSYRVVWPGGVNIRSLPSLKGKRLGTRELHDIVDTVLRVGKWIKIREIPGVTDSGWILTEGPCGKLLEQIET